MEEQQTSTNDSNGWVGGPIACESWQQAQHAVYQLGCFIIANGFLVPPTVGIYQALWLRICLVLGLFCHVLWAGPALCWPDGLTWQLAAFFANVAHLVYLSYLSYPVNFDEDVQKVYQALFKPFNVSRQQFRVMLDSGGDIYELDRTGHYAAEGRTKTDRVLSLLISGRMRVSANGRFLHHIYPAQFLDSLEWQGSRSNCGPSTFQVTVTAETDCRYIQWQKKALDKFLRKEGFMRVVFETTVGKDITTKLYSINEETPEGPSVPKLTQRANKGVVPAPAPRVTVPEIAEICLPDEQEEDRGLLSHKWERALSISDEESGAGVGVGGGGTSPQTFGGMNQLVVPRSGSVSSLHSVRSMVDIRASIASGRGADVAGRSSLTPDAATGDRSFRLGSMTSHTSEPMLAENASKRSSFESDHGAFPEQDKGESHFVSSV